MRIGQRYTNDSILEGIRKYTSLNGQLPEGSFGMGYEHKEDDNVNAQSQTNEGLSTSNINPSSIKVSKDAKINQAAWEKAYAEYGKTLGLNDHKAYLHLLGQIMHESGSFRYMEELASGKAYEGRKDLGNIYEGDGVRFKGRGPIQVTGRSNYKTIYEKFFIPNGLGHYNIVEHPELGSDPYIGSLMTFGWILTTNNGKRTITACNNYDVLAATKAINGGTNGLDDRRVKTATLLQQNNLV